MRHDYFALAAQLAFTRACRRTDQGATTMSSKYDAPHPGQDPVDCRELTTDDPIKCDMCLWCAQPYTDRVEYPYCSTTCKVQAECDSWEDDW